MTASSHVLNQVTDARGVLLALPYTPSPCLPSACESPTSTHWAQRLSQKGNQGPELNMVPFVCRVAGADGVCEQRALV